MNSVKLIATDMDGTLLNSRREISEENIQMIKAAQRAGIIVCAATGRDYAEASHPLKKAGLSLPIIGTNGAEVYLEDGELLAEKGIEETLFRTITEELENQNVYYEVYTNKGAFTVNKQQGLNLVIDVLTGKGSQYTLEEAHYLAEQRFEEGAIKVIDSFQALLEERTRILKILAFSAELTVRNKVRYELADLPLIITSSAMENLEINYEKATKGRGLRTLADHYNIDIAYTLAIGDNENDLSMFQEAAFSAAMENAVESVKEAAGSLTSSNNESGVAKVIEKVLVPEKKSL
ncbi:Cof-type HAD-IIB family hydrolase [Alkalicoccus daliensis]|uniref:HAD family phosphatase n=1 Tax=Alkalicoccus daliensis TaxID=745820 RepID=A0A1H0B0E3_9BACI|nr:Cof-type HAD-IIB family hydrolase [Alkalicoccus daliensis]SDN39121.1 hypothetical protein SAMN04488053_101701 [Alkalicoccus daliensis]